MLTGPWDEGLAPFAADLSGEVVVSNQPTVALSGFFALRSTARLPEALAPWLLPAWPRTGAVALVERNAERFREDWHVFDRWCWLGTVHSFDAAHELARSAERRFEADAARLAVQAVSAAPRWPVEVVELTAAQRVAAGASAAGGSGHCG